MATTQQPINHLQGYKRHITSEFLKDRLPYTEDIRGHLKADDVSMAHGERLFPRLVEQLKMPGIAPEKLVEALRTICDLCSNQENKCQAIASDVVAAATNLLTHENIPVRRDAARVIGSMGLLIGGRSLMPVGNSTMSRKLTGPVGVGSTLPRLAKLLIGCDDEEVKMNVARAMQSITIFRDGCQQVVDQGIVRSIAQYLYATLPDLPHSEHLALCLLYLLQTLAAVTMYANQGMRDLFGVHLIERIVGFLDRAPKDGPLPGASLSDSTQAVREALRLLWHCGNDPRGRKETLQAEGVRVITLYLDAADAKVREAAVCALNVLSLETKGKQDILAHSIGGLAQLLHNGERETTYLHETCVQLARSASELPAFRFAFARRLLQSTWLLEKIYGTASLGAISPLLGPEEPLDVRVQAVEVAAHFLCTASEGDLIRVPPVCPLSNIQAPALYALEECVDILHNLVFLTDATRGPAMACLEAMCKEERARKELEELITDGRIVVPEAVQRDVSALLQAPPSAASA